MRRFSILCAAGAVLATTGCQDLDVTNPNEPEIETVLRNGDALQAFLAGNFRNLWSTLQGSRPNWPASTAADQLSAVTTSFANPELSNEPRVALPNNNSVTVTRNVHREMWLDLYRTISISNDVLRAMKNDPGLVVGVNNADAPRARAYAKFLQGVAHGYVALYYDQGWVIDENVDLPADVSQFGTVVKLQPSDAVLAASIAQLKEAAALSQTRFTLPSTWVPGLAIDNVELAKLANTYIARFMVYSTRRPSERRAVAWATVLQHLNAGIAPEAENDASRHDFAPVADPAASFSSPFKQNAQTEASMRADYKLLGPADTTGAYQNWIRRAPASRTPFVVFTPDRRIAARDSANGTYFSFRRVQSFASTLGTYHQSFYFLNRFNNASGSARSWEVGPQPVVTRAELDLIRAEAYLHLGDPDRAAGLINRTRVRNGGLPVVTAAGVPTARSCVPKTQLGACGSLFDALRYEKRIESAGVEGSVAYWDARGWGTLLIGTPVHFPVPWRDLELIGVPLYTFGGGGPGSVTAADTIAQ
ncbi:MAG TPA: RagB/SusD family nutrient uptake outer membrane protein [Longimicrobiaceae bacterium]|nr:RagB/SusD family nutrient uptake outer membrane protein [Longimicrobiaceae bacterium]